jgi:MFS family permease
MFKRKSGLSAPLTLIGCTACHAFTHAYACMLVPLYLLMVVDLHLPGVRAASLVVAIYGITYCLGSYAAGVLADLVNRKSLLGYGLALNALVAIGIGLTRRYDLLLILSVVGGLTGSLFHPAAGALVPAHYPKNPGMAIGLLGIGSGIGFFVGPQYAGWRAETARWHWGNIANWQRPCIEMGLAGLVVAALFLLLAREAVADEPASARRKSMEPRLRWNVMAIASVLGLRDFVGVALLSLASVYLQKAMHEDTQRAGLVLGAMTALSIVVNPILVWLSMGRLRLRSLATSVIGAGCVITLIPLCSGNHVFAILCAAQTLQMGSYAISDAAILERVPAQLRGRVYGLFLFIAGTMANTAPWLMGWWTDRFGAAGTIQRTYLAPFVTLGAMVALASLAVPLIARLGAAKEPAINPLSEVAPSMMEPAL